MHTLVPKRKRDTGKDSGIVRRKKYQELLFSEDTVIDWGVILKEVSTDLASGRNFLWVVQQQPTQKLVVVPDSTMYKDSFSLLYKQAESKNGVKCSRAIIILGALRDNAAVDVFKTGLISSNSSVRLASIRALSHLQTTGATNIILDAMEHNTGNGGNIPWERLTERLNGKWASCFRKPVGLYC